LEGHSKTGSPDLLDIKATARGCQPVLATARVHVDEYHPPCLGHSAFLAYLYAESNGAGEVARPALSTDVLLDCW